MWSLSLIEQPGTVRWGKQPGRPQFTADTSASVAVIAGGGPHHTGATATFYFPPIWPADCASLPHVKMTIIWLMPFHEQGWLLHNLSWKYRKKKLLTCEKSSFPQFVPISRGNAEVKIANAQSDAEAEWAFTEQCRGGFFFFPSNTEQLTGPICTVLCLMDQHIQLLQVESCQHV